MSPEFNGNPISVLAGELASFGGMSVTPDEPLASRTTLKIGGPAELFAKVFTEPALQHLLNQARALSVPWRILGLGSNVLVPDEGLEGLTVVLAGDFLELSISDSEVTAGAGLPLGRVARSAVESGLTGLEALAGFPSTVGGAVVMNAGCYGVEIKDILECATVLLPEGGREVVRVDDIAPGYRSTNLQGRGAIVTQATFRLRTGDAGEAQQRLIDLNRRRRASMPSGKPNAGSVFKNPEGGFAGRLIEACGLKGIQSGGAEISPAHANVIVNNGAARAADVLELMLIMRCAVADKFQVALEPELILVGALGDRWHQMLADRRR